MSDTTTRLEDLLVMDEALSDMLRLIEDCQFILGKMHELAQDLRTGEALREL